MSSAELEQAAQRLPPSAVLGRSMGNAAALLLACLLAACDAGDAQPAPLQLRLAPGARPQLHDELLADLLAPQDLALWSLRGGTLQRPAEGGLDLRADPGAGRVWLRRPFRADPARFDGVRVRLAAGLPVGLSLALFRRGALVGRTAVVPVGSSIEPLELLLELPAALASRGVCDELGLAFTGPPSRLRLRSVELLRRSGAARVPDPAQGAQAVTFAGETRHGWGLSQGAPLLGQARVPRAGRLLMSVGVPVSSVPDARLRLDVEPGGVTHSWRLDELDGSGPWRPLSVDLSALAGQQVRLRLSLQGGREAACVLAGPRLSGPARAPPRSVLLITSDTHRGDHLGALPGGVELSTPTLDALAARGVLFEDCFAPINFTNPSHAALLTGKHPRDLGLIDNRSPLAPDVATLACVYAEAGWETWAAVSVGHLSPGVSGLGRGFSRFSAPLRVQRSADDTLDVVARWLDEQPPSRPLFLWLHVFDAHTPYDVPEPFDERGYDGPPDPFDPSLPEPELDTPLRGALAGLRHLEWGRLQYRNLVSYLDHALARVLQSAPFGDGLVALVGDHGESLGEHGLWFVHAELYRDTLHVPLLLAGPGVERGLLDDRPVSHLDLGRTLLDLSGLEAATFPGTSLLSPAWRRGPRPGLSSLASSACWSEDGWHLILHLRAHGGFARHQVELFELSTDKRCLHDLVDQEPQRAAALRRKLVAWLAAAPSRADPGADAVDPELLADLEALGYVETGGEGPFWQADACAWCTRWP
ncbi:MAG: hypothetical protein DRQ55_10310 [Planctomycetota bacterium]|nr:MAG: hypothetical protein DRQ55_10310 [Planctomycetota bacterium]